MKSFKKPWLEVVELDIVDVITASENTLNTGEFDDNIEDIIGA